MLSRTIKTISAFTLILVAFIISGCSASSGDNPLLPSATSRISQGNNRTLWGFYQIYVDTAKGSMEFTPLRQIEMHLNAVKYLETPTSTLVSLESPPVISGGKLNVDIGLKHPLPQQIYCGFDVRGTLITKGSADFGGGLLAPKAGDFRLLNADGYTRFWNPTEFTGTGYQDGILGTPHSVGGFNATVNGFKYFATGLGKDDPFDEFIPDNRGAFLSGEKNVRHYTIAVDGTGLFNYAVDASWAMPDNTPPVIPDDFDVNKANSKEAWKIVPHVINHLSPTGGTYSLSVDVYDWQGGITIQEVKISAPGLFSGWMNLTAGGETPDFVSYSIEFTNTLQGTGDIPLLISVPDTTSSSSPYQVAYQMLTISVPEISVTLAEDENYKTPGKSYEYSVAGFDLSTEVPPVDYLNMGGPWDFTSIAFTTSHVIAILPPDDPEVAPFAGDFPAGVEYFIRQNDDPALYQAESHDEAGSAVKLYGIYAPTQLDAPIIFSSPAVFPYPYNKSTSFTVQKSIPIVPGLLTYVMKYTVVIVGQGWVKSPENGGTWHNTLLLRGTIRYSSTGILGEGWLGTMLQNQFIDDDGTVIAQILSGNAKGEPLNFNETTFEITGQGAFEALWKLPGQ